MNVDSAVWRELELKLIVETWKEREASRAWVIQLKCYVVVINKMISRTMDGWSGTPPWSRTEWKVSSLVTTAECTELRQNWRETSTFIVVVVHVHKIERVCNKMSNANKSPQYHRQCEPSPRLVGKSCISQEQQQHESHFSFRQHITNSWIFSPTIIVDVYLPSGDARTHIQKSLSNIKRPACSSGKI